MAFEDIVRKIQENTDRKIQEIQLEFEKEKNIIIQNATKKLEEIKQSIQKETDNKIQSEKIRLSAIENVELNKEIVVEKKKLIDKVFAIAFEKILNLPEKEFKQLLLELIVKYIETGNEEILIPENYYKNYGENLLKEINAELKRKMAKSSGIVPINSDLKLKSTKTISSGFVIKSDLKELNATFEMIFRKYREELEPKVNHLLFFSEEKVK